MRRRLFTAAVLAIAFPLRHIEWRANPSDPEYNTRPKDWSEELTEAIAALPTARRGDYPAREWCV